MTKLVKKENINLPAHRVINNDLIMNAELPMVLRKSITAYANKQMIKELTYKNAVAHIGQHVARTAFQAGMKIQDLADVQIQVARLSAACRRTLTGHPHPRAGTCPGRNLDLQALTING